MVTLQIMLPRLTWLWHRVEGSHVRRTALNRTARSGMVSELAIRDAVSGDMRALGYVGLNSQAGVVV